MRASLRRVCLRIGARKITLKCLSSKDVAAQVDKVCAKNRDIHLQSQGDDGSRGGGEDACGSASSAGGEFIVAFFDEAGGDEFVDQT